MPHQFIYWQCKNSGHNLTKNFVL